MITYSIMTLLNTIWAFLGIVDSDLFYWIWYITNTYRSYILILNGYVFFGVKFLSIVVLKRMLTIQDDFLSQFVLFLNSMIAGVLSMAHSFSSDAYNSQLAMKGLPPFSIQHSPFSWKFKFFYFYGYIAYCVVANSAIYWVQRKRKRSQIIDQQSQHSSNRNVNNQSQNPEVLPRVMALGALFFLSLPSVLKLFYKDKLAIVIAQLEAIAPFFCLPILILKVNVSFRTYAKEFYELSTLL